MPPDRVAAWVTPWLVPAVAPDATPATRVAVPLTTEDAAEARKAAPITVAVAQVRKPFAVSRKNTS